MAYAHKEGSGALFRTNKKEPGSKHPDAPGEVMIGRTLYEIAGWIKEGKHGKWTSLAVKPKEAEQPKRTTRPPADDMSDDPLPF